MKNDAASKVSALFQYCLVAEQNNREIPAIFAIGSFIGLRHSRNDLRTSCQSHVSTKLSFDPSECLSFFLFDKLVEQTSNCIQSFLSADASLCVLIAYFLQLDLCKPVIQLGLRQNLKTF
jgi:hypothetical protein